MLKIAINIPIVGKEEISVVTSILKNGALTSASNLGGKYVQNFEKTINPFAYEILFDSEEAETYKIIPEIQNQKDTFLAIALWDELCAGHTDEQALLEGADAAWGWLIKNGANAIMTDRPEELIEYLRKEGLHN